MKTPMILVKLKNLGFGFYWSLNSSPASAPQFQSTNLMHTLWPPNTCMTGPHLTQFNSTKKGEKPSQIFETDNKL